MAFSAVNAEPCEDTLRYDTFFEWDRSMCLVIVRCNHTTHVPLDPRFLEFLLALHVTHEFVPLLAEKVSMFH
jgi:hypothetical protein